jgi:acyl-homoserine-lactone acylase
MHTSSGVDVVDEFLETVEQKGDRLTYRYGAETRPVQTVTVTVPYRAADGRMASRSFETYRTHHGPIVREEGGKWVAFSMMHKPVEALQQSYLRTKAKDYAGFMHVAELKANSSNNTLFADAKGNIAYLHPQFVPVRDDSFDYSKPVDGSNPRTDWRGIHALNQVPSVLNPPNGWLQNTNNWPWSAAGPHSPKQADFPRYMETFGENQRGVHAIRVLEGRKDFTLDGLRDAAYDSWLPAFADLVPGLITAWEREPGGSALKAQLAGQIAALRSWDYRWGVESVPTSLAVFWGEEMLKSVVKGGVGRNLKSFDTMRAATDRQKLDALAAASARLTSDFGRWQVPWGEINRFQRLTGDIVHKFRDDAPSIPVGFTSAGWGSLASFVDRPTGATKRRYGVSGNSFVAVVEFGDKVRARAVSAGGESGDPRSRHFNDQAGHYAAGNLREVYFYPAQLKGRTERTYRPGK